MKKAEITKSLIIRRAAELFNLKGYAGSSIADIMQATGLKKGGIYNHFKSKDEIALAAFDYAVSLVQKRAWSVVKTKKNAISRLQALLKNHLDYLEHPPLPGGCPIMNTAIESDDAYPLLRDRALAAMQSWHDLVVRIISIGIEKGELSKTVDPGAVDSFLISTIEGSIMLSKLYQDDIHLRRAIATLDNYVTGLGS